MDKENIKKETYNEISQAYRNNQDISPGIINKQKFSRPVIELNKTGFNLRKLRENNNLTRKELASLLNTSYPTISNWENSNKLPNVDTLLTISKLFNVHMEDLISSKESKSFSLDEVLDALEQHCWFLTSSKGNGRIKHLKFKKLRSFYDEFYPYTRTDREDDTSVLFDIFKIVKLKKWVHVKTIIHRKPYINDEVEDSFVSSVTVTLNRKYLTTDHIKPNEDLNNIFKDLYKLNRKIDIGPFSIEDSITLGKDLIDRIAVETDDEGIIIPNEGIYVYEIDNMEVPFIFYMGALDGNQYEGYRTYPSLDYAEVLEHAYPAIYYKKELPSGKTMEVKEYWSKGLPQYIVVNNGEYLETWQNG